MVDGMSFRGGEQFLASGLGGARRHCVGVTVVGLGCWWVGLVGARSLGEGGDNGWVVAVRPGWCWWSTKGSMLFQGKGNISESLRWGGKWI